MRAFISPMRANALVVALAAAVSGFAGCAAQSGAALMRHPPALSALPRALVHRDDVSMVSMDNGLSLVVLPEKSTNLVKVDVRYRVGAAEDPVGKAGLAHLVEHMSFQLYARDSGGPTLRDELASDALYHNAYTNWDETHFTSVGFAGQLASLLRLEAIRMAAPCSRLGEGNFAREREVVRNEIRSRTGPAATSHTLVRGAVYGYEHPYTRSIGGSDRTVAAMARDDSCRFMADYYAPDRAILLVSGAVEAERVTSLVTAIFSPIAKRASKPRAKIEPVALAGTESRHELGVKESTAHIAFAASAQGSDDAAHERLLVAIAERQLFSTLSRHPGVSDLDVGLAGGIRAPLVVVSISTREPEQLRSAVVVAFARMSQLFDDFEIHHFVALRERRRAALLRAAEPFMREAVVLADYAQYASHDSFLARDLELLSQANRSDLIVRARALFDRKASHVAYVIPNGEAKPVEERASLRFAHKEYDLRDWRTPVDLEEAGRALEIPGQRLKPALRAFSLPTGLQVLLVPSLQYPLVDIRMVFAAGSLHDPSGRPGLARMAMLLLQRDKVRVKSPSQAMAIGAIMGMGGDLDRYMDEQTTTFRMTGLSMYLDGLLWDLHWLLENGIYSPRALAAVRSLSERGASGLESSTKRQIQALMRALYGARHPYAAPEGDERIAWRISPRDLEQFRRAHYRVRGATLIVTGSFDAALAETEIRRLFSWGQGPSAPPLPAVPHAASPGWAQYLAAFDESRVQTEIVVGFALPPGFGPGFAKRHARRLVLEEMVRDKVSALRETLGTTYGVDVDEVSRRGPGMFLVSASVDRERAAEAFAALRQALSQLRAGDFTAEFVRARRKVLREALADTLTSESVADQLEFVVTYGVPRTYHDELARHVAKIRPGDIGAMLARELAPRREVVLVRGRRQSVERLYRTAGIADYRLVE